MTGSISLIIIGVILIFLAIKILNNFKSISKEGVNVKGIVFEFEQIASTGTSVSYPIVRFLTLQNEWITQKSTAGVVPGFYKKGEELNIIYQKDNPNKFYVKDKKTSSVPLIIIAIALVLIILGILKSMNVVN
jgi:hypothetical protein